MWETELDSGAETSRVWVKGFGDLGVEVEVEVVRKTKQSKGKIKIWAKNNAGLGEERVHSPNGIIRPKTKRVVY